MLALLPVAIELETAELLVQPPMALQGPLVTGTVMLLGAFVLQMILLNAAVVLETAVVLLHAPVLPPATLTNLMVTQVAPLLSVLAMPPA